MTPMLLDYLCDPVDKSPLALRNACYAADGSITAADGWIASMAAGGSYALVPDAEPSAPRSLLAASARALVFGEEPSTVWFHHDHLGTSSATTDAQGAVLQRTWRHPHGTLRTASHAWTEAYGFTGKEEDDATGWTYFGARYLDPQLGRWTAPDPSYAYVRSVDVDRTGEVGSPYGFALDNPMTWVDPDGRSLLSVFASLVKAPVTVPIDVVTKPVRFMIRTKHASGGNGVRG